MSKYESEGNKIVLKVISVDKKMWIMRKSECRYYNYECSRWRNIVKSIFPSSHYRLKWRCWKSMTRKQRLALPIILWESHFPHSHWITAFAFNGKTDKVIIWCLKIRKTDTQLQKVRFCFQFYIKFVWGRFKFKTYVRIGSK